MRQSTFHHPSPGAASSVLLSGMLAGVFSMLVLGWAGKRHNGRMLGPINAPAHWLWGNESLRQDGASMKHTATGVLIHQMSSMFWAVLHALVQSRRQTPPSATQIVTDAAAVTALAAAVDLKLVPERLTPGFQHRMPRKSVVLVYLAFAAGLGVAAAATRRASR